MGNGSKDMNGKTRYDGGSIDMTVVHWMNGKTYDVGTAEEQNTKMDNDKDEIKSQTLR